jgi:hypothetical protein
MRLENEVANMSSIQKLAIITGASQGIGAALVTAYRKLGYAVVANSRSIGKSDDPDVLTVPGSTPSSTMPASSSPSRSPTTPTKTMTPSLEST